MTTHAYHSIRWQTGLLLLASSCMARYWLLSLYEQTASSYYKAFAGLALLLVILSLDILKNNFKGYRRRKHRSPLEIEPELPLQKDLEHTPRISDRVNFLKPKKRKLALSSGNLVNLRTTTHR